MSNTNLQEAIKSVSESPASLFTREDVVKLLAGLDGNHTNSALSYPNPFQTDESEVPVPALTRVQYDQLVSDISETINEAIGRLNESDITDVEFGLSGNEIQLEYCSIEADNVLDAALDTIEGFFTIIDED